MGDAEFGLAGYKMFRKDRLIKRGGGGGIGGGGVGGGGGGGGVGGGVMMLHEDTRLHKVIAHASRGECLIMGDFNQTAQMEVQSYYY